MIIKFCKLFYWNNEKGIPWRVILIQNARKEFEASKEEKDPVILGKMLIRSHEALQELSMKLNEMKKMQKNKIILNK